MYVKEGLKAVKAEVEVFYPEHVWCRISNANGNLYNLYNRSATDHQTKIFLAKITMFI